MLRLTLFRHLLKVARKYDRQPALKALLQIYPRRVYNHELLRWDELGSEEVADLMEEVSAVGEDIGGGVPRGYIEPEPTVLSLAYELTSKGDYYKPTQSVAELVKVAARKKDTKGEPLPPEFDPTKAALACLRSLNYHLYTLEQLLPQPAYPPYPQKFTLQDKLTKGCLLVAHPMQFGYFAHSVLLILDCNSEGAIGFVVNQPLRAPYMFQGGPVNRRKWFPLQRMETAEEHSMQSNPDEQLPRSNSSPTDSDSSSGGKKEKPYQELLKGLYLMKDSIHVGATEEENAGKFMLVAGYAEWGRKQLEGEIEQNAWFVVSCENPAEVAFAAAVDVAASTAALLSERRSTASSSDSTTNTSTSTSSSSSTGSTSSTTSTSTSSSSATATPSSPSSAAKLSPHPYKLWVQVLAALGGEYAQFARIPERVLPPGSNSSASSSGGGGSGGKGEPSSQKKTT